MTTEAQMIEMEYRAKRWRDKLVAAGHHAARVRYEPEVGPWCRVTVDLNGHPFAAYCVEEGELRARYGTSQPT